MDRIVNIHTAKTTLSKLLAEVEDGGEVVIARAGKPIAKLVPMKRRKARLKLDRRPGQMKDQIWIGPDFEAPLPDDILKAFHGESD